MFKQELETQSSNTTNNGLYGTKQKQIKNGGAVKEKM